MSIFTNLFGAKVLPPPELVKKTLELFVKLEARTDDPAKQEKARTGIAEQLGAMKVLLFGDPEAKEKPPSKEDIDGLVREVCLRSDLLKYLVSDLEHLEFESRKDAVQVFNFMLRASLDGGAPGVAYVDRHPELLTELSTGYATTEIAVQCGSMLRACLLHEPLLKQVLASAELWLFFDYIEVPDFGISADAFQTFTELLARHKDDARLRWQRPLVNAFLEANYAPFFDGMNRLLRSDNYIVRRQSVKLVQELLLDRDNADIMLKYSSTLGNLQLIMILLADTSASIQFEAFHVFKCFVVNPKRPAALDEVLLQNAPQLLAFLQAFKAPPKITQQEMETFNEEKAALITMIDGLQASH